MSTRRKVGACGCGAPLFVDVVAGQVVATVIWSCNHGPPAVDDDRDVEA